jgi:hypothetical protein
MRRGKTPDRRIRTTGQPDLSLPSNPLDVIAADLMRAREVCAMIDRIGAGALPGAGARETVIAFLTGRLPHLLADEKLDLYPLMTKRCRPEDEIDRTIGRLAADHDPALADLPRLVGLLRDQTAAATECSRAARARMTAFTTRARQHLILENAIVLPIARRRLTRRDLQLMTQHMLGRRGVGRLEPDADP